MGVVNSKALERLKIEDSTKDPIGGKIGRVNNSKEPNGYLEENAFIHTSQQIEQSSEKILEKQIEQAQEIYLENGITTAQDGLTKRNEINLLTHMAEKRKLKMDIVSYLDIRENKNLIEENWQYYKQYNNRLKIGGYKLILDGSPQGKTAWLTQPYEGEKEYRGYRIYSDKEIEKIVQETERKEIQLLTHCNGDAAAEQLIHAYEKTKKEMNKKTRPVMIHAQTIRNDQIKRMKDISLMPSYFVAHVYYWGDTHINNLGERAYHISPIKSTINEKIPFTLHQDSPVIMPNMLETIWCAVNRQTRSGIVLGEKEKIDVYEALKGVTIYAAYQYLEENKKGSIEEGKLGDFVILDQNPLAIEKEKIREIQVMETIKEGETVYKKLL